MLPELLQQVNVEPVLLAILGGCRVDPVSDLVPTVATRDLLQFVFDIPPGELVQRLSGARGHPRAREMVRKDFDMKISHAKAYGWF
jgi:hypothetical protein